MAELFKISRQGYYKLFNAYDSFEQDAKVIRKLVLRIRRFMPRIGGKKLYFVLKPELNRLGINIGRDRFFDILR
jgi:putative transposase